MNTENSNFANILENFKREEEIEKKELKNIAKVISLSLIFQIAAIYLINYLTLFGFTVADIFIKGAKDYFYNQAVMQVKQILFSSFSFLAPFILITKICGYNVSDLVSFKKTGLKASAPLFFFGAAFCLFANIASNYFDRLFKVFGFDFSSPAASQVLPEGIFGFILVLLARVITPAFVEEFIFRGITLGFLKKFGSTFAIFISALLFGVMHGNMNQIPFAFLVGIYLGFVAIKTESLRIVILIHAFNNFISVFMHYCFNDFSNDFKNMFYTVFLIVMLIIGIISAFFFKDKEIFDLEEGNTFLSFKEKSKVFLLSSGIIIYFLYTVLKIAEFVS